MTSARKLKRKTSFKVSAPPPRNPLVAPARARKAGAHRKRNKALRAAEKVALKKEADKSVF